MSRTAHLVGSLPGRNSAEAMTGAAQILGPYLESLPGGETGDRRDWIAFQVKALGRGIGALVNRNPDADWAAKGTPLYAIRDGETLTAADLTSAMPYAGDASGDYHVFRRLALESPRLLQVGVPAAWDQVICSFGPSGLSDARYCGPVGEATVAQLAAIAGLAGEVPGGPGVVIQLETVMMLADMAAAGPEDRPALAKAFAAQLAEVAGAAPARYGLHICAGDFGHNFLTDLGRTGLGPVVQLASAAAQAIPGLAYVHIPGGWGRVPPPVDLRFWEPLSWLELPDEVEVALGFVHEGRTVDELRQVQELAEAAAARPLRVAAPCGLGRRSDPAEPGQIMAAMAELCRTA